MATRGDNLQIIIIPIIKNHQDTSFDLLLASWMGEHISAEYEVSYGIVFWSTLIDKDSAIYFTKKLSSNSRS